MIKELVFHLGNRKTGSTSIQDALLKNVVNCPEKTIFYTANPNNRPLALSLNPQQQQQEKKKRFEKLAARMKKNSNADVAVVSAECFEDVDPRHLQEAINHYLPEFRNKIRLIAYVRPHADRILSNYAENIKLGLFQGTLEDYHQQTNKPKSLFYTTNLFYTEKFKAWRTIFGSAFELRPFIRKHLLNCDIVYDFAEYMLKGSSFTLQQNVASNQSLSTEYLAMIREYQQIQQNKHVKRGQKMVFGKYMGGYLATRPVPGHHKLHLHKDIVKSIIATYQNDARMLDTEFFPKDRFIETALLASYETAAEKEQALIPPDNMAYWHTEMDKIWNDLHSSGK